MTQGIAINIGLNGVDPAAYNGWNGALSGCVNDANAMHDIAVSCGYNPTTTLLNEQATSTAVLRAIGQAAKTLVSGDILLLTYSGHGGQIADTNGDEDDHLDETWVLYDRMLVDDELYLLWSQFNPGVRIFLLSDSCHSGTIERMALYRQLQTVPALVAQRPRGASAQSALKAIPQDLANSLYQRDKYLYDAIQWTAARGNKAALDSTVILISGCQDGQLSGDGATNGTFTTALLNVWNNGAFRGDYHAFCNQIIQQMPPSQTPNFGMVGAVNTAFEGQKPFAIAGNGTVSVMPPQIAISPNWNPGDPPLFQVLPGANSYYAVEVATNSTLFDNANHGSERTTDNFYASWSDTALLSESTYQLPANIWQNLSSSNPALYYRVLTSSAADQWDNLMASTPDESAETAPHLEITRARLAA